MGPFVEIQKDVIIGDHTVIGSHSFIAAGTIIGKRVFVGHNVTTCNDKHPVANNRDWECKPPVIGHDVSIGSGAIILPNVAICRYAKIGAGAIITKDINEWWDYRDAIVGIW